MFFFLDVAPNEEVEIPETFFKKPLPGFENVEYDYCIWLAWFVVILSARKYFIGVMGFLVRLVQRNVNVRLEFEVGAQHEHAD